MNPDHLKKNYLTKENNCKHIDDTWSDLDLLQDKSILIFD